MSNEYSTVTVKKVALKEDWLKFRSICTLTGTDATKAIKEFVSDTVKAGRIDKPIKDYDPNYGDNRVCVCGHEYHRHFDSYECMEPVGCKYCGCMEFKERK